MKKLILLVTLLATFGASAGQITHEQLVQINKFNKGWTNIMAMENKGVAMKIQQHNVYIPSYRLNPYIRYECPPLSRRTLCL
jgi:hypothetical protein